MVNYYTELKNSFPTVEDDELKRYLLNKYNNDSIVLDSNEMINIDKYLDKVNEDSNYFLDLPNKKGVFYYNDTIYREYIFVEGSSTEIISGYLDKLKVYEVCITYEITNRLNIVPLVVEYSNVDILEIHEVKNGKLTFQPNEKTDKYEIVFKISGQGVIYNIDINHITKKRNILSEKSITFSENDFFLNERYSTAEIEGQQTVIHVKPNERKHIYVSYKEKNNNYSKLPQLNILDNIDLTSNILVEFNILKDDTLEFIPMLIEYDDYKKIGQKMLNIYNPEVIKLKPEVTNVRLAFRFSGYGDLKVQNLNFISLEELPTKHRIDFRDRKSVIQLLNPNMSLKEFKVACIMDEFTYNSFEQEVQMYKLDVDHWKSQLLFIQPDLVFIESAWVGNNGLWHRQVAFYDEIQHKNIKNLIEFSKKMNIPVIFWNKEDPVHYDKFIETAKLCDFVFTTDKGRVKQYKIDCGHNNVEALPFAAQPKNHNPIKIQKERDPRVSFAGSYYRHHEERSRDMDILLEASKEVGLVIYDRNYEKTKRGLMPNHQFPDKFRQYIHGTLPFNLIDKSYKGYKFMINVNTVKQSETMFSRRVFEGLISGTPIISTYSLGMKKLFGSIINASNNIQDLQNHLNKLQNNNELYNKYSVRGIREVLLKHTYEDRMKKILNSVGYRVYSDSQCVNFIAFINNSSEIDQYINIFNRQSVKNKKMILFSKNINDFKEFYNCYNTEQIHAFDYNYLKKYSNLKKILGEGSVSVLNYSNYYAPNYGLDLVLAIKYSFADVIGKGMYYTKNDKNIEIVNENKDFIFYPDLKVDRSIIDISIFDKFSMETTLTYLEGQTPLSELIPFGAKLFSSDSLNFIELADDIENSSFVDV